MKFTVTTTLSVLALAMFPACGDSSSDKPDPGEVCDTVCQKEESCNLLGTATVQDCLAECEEYAGYMLDSYLSALGDCFGEKSCDELAVTATPQDACYEDHVDLCTTDTESYVEAACVKDFECDGITDPTAAQMANCMERMHADGNILICFEPAKIAELQSCVENAESCTPNPIRECTLEVVGLELGTGGTGS